MATINFTIKKGENPATIYVRLSGGYIEGEYTKNGLPKKLDVVAPTKYRIDPKEWNVEKQRLKNPRNLDNKSINDYLEGISIDVRRHYEKSTGNVAITSKWLKSLLTPSKGINGFTGRLADYVEIYRLEKQSENKAKNKSGTSYDKKLTTLKNKLEKFEKWNKEPVYIKYANRDLIQQFTKFSNESGYSHNTIARDILHIKMLCTHAGRNGHAVNPDAVNISAGYSASEAVYLTLDELKTLREMRGSIPRIERARQWLLISCYSGQRVSDFLKFNSKMISNETDHAGEPLKMITFRQHKTNKDMSIALHPVILDILEANGGEFPTKINEQQYNRDLKDLCKEAKFKSIIKGSKMTEIGKDSEGNKIFRKTSATFEKWELVTSHIGRRSFATNHYGKMPTPYIMAITGHVTEKEFLKYIRVGSAELTKVAYKYFQ